MTEDKRRLIASDEKTKRIIFNIGSQRVAFDLTSRVTKLPPRTGEQPAAVLSIEKRKESK